MKRNDPYLKLLHAQLRDFASERDQDRLRVLADALRAGIRHPLEVADSGLFSDTHPVRLEALAVFDAFEAVTNGMENPEAMERIAALPEHSIFLPWKPLILAISAFYRGDRTGLAEQMARIPSESVPGLLVPLLASLPDTGPGHGSSDAERDLVSAVVDDDPLLRSGLSQLEDALEVGIEELFIETAVLLFRELVKRQPSSAERLLLWCLHAMRGAGLVVETLSNRVRTFLPACRLHRIEALAALDTDPDASLTAWMRSLLAGLREEALSLAEVSQYLMILQDLLDAAEEEGSLSSNEEYESTAGNGLRKLAEELGGELSFRFGIPAARIPPATRPRTMLRAVAETVAARDRQEQAEDRPAQTNGGGRNGTRPGNGHMLAARRRHRVGRDPAAEQDTGAAAPPKQLDLFSFSDAHG